MRRVVVTGLGMVSPLACGVEETWRRLIAGDSAAAPITHFKADDLPCRIAMPVPRGDGSAGTFNADRWLEHKEQRKVDDFIIFAVAAATQALDDAGWHPRSADDRAATGVYFGAGIGGLNGIHDQSVILYEKGPRRISPFFVTGRLINLAGGYVSIMHGLKGPNHACVTACSSGTHAIGDAARLIALEDAEVMVAGGCESTISRIGIGGFSACRALSTGFNDRPTEASRPFDRDRDGFVMGEGAGAVVLESLEHAKARGARIYAEVVGYGLSGDAFHITAPDESGDGAYRAMRAALKRAKIGARDLDYINAHGTSTPLGDEIELRTVQKLLAEERGGRLDGNKLAISSTKSAIGHLLGAAGAVEAVFSVLALRDQVVPPTLNLDNPPDFAAVDLVPHEARRREVGLVLSNSFGFGGTNACLILRHPDA